ncbi:hypothetical protein D0962_37240 [Leptolyngbyaceae cyanobacterium CCMR0082]|uniref:Uncharacterized protein n=1 Tax=Adonisia turfae CCMR0082 TaxID=2304604 RepID=A0A6M0SJ08_9CYAN|nr:hypothetical protein [Adonisia turfae]NEZ68314.1 hypothetical protein [Adonisia turfae CCMR0082]
MIGTIPAQTLSPQQEIIIDAPQELQIEDVNIKFRDGSVTVTNEGSQPVNIAGSRRTGGDD